MKKKNINFHRQKISIITMLKSKKHDPFTILYLRLHDILFKISQGRYKTNSAAVLPDIKTYSRCDQIVIMVGRDSHRY